jgi:hypothetical protein
LLLSIYFGCNFKGRARGPLSAEMMTSSQRMHYRGWLHRIQGPLADFFALSYSYSYNLQVRVVQQFTGIFLGVSVQGTCGSY